MELGQYNAATSFLRCNFAEDKKKEKKTVFPSGLLYRLSLVRAHTRASKGIGFFLISLSLSLSLSFSLSLSLLIAGEKRTLTTNIGNEKRSLGDFPGRKKLWEEMRLINISHYNIHLSLSLSLSLSPSSVASKNSVIIRSDRSRLEKIEPKNHAWERDFEAWS